MGAIHNELRKGLLSKALKVALGVEQTEAALERFSESLQPTVDLWARPEWAILQGLRLWVASPSQGAVAAEFQQVGVRNPIGSGAIVVVTHWSPDETTPTGARLYALRWRAIQTPDDIDAKGVVQSRDLRSPSQLGLRTQGLANSVAGAALGSNLFRMSRGTNTGAFPVPVNIILPPGFDLLSGSDTVNIGALADFWGYERTALPGELETRS